jgi:polyphosphate glucokinase
MSETTPPTEPGPGAPGSGPVTLAIDVGGTGLKAARLDAAGLVIGTALRIATPHPAPPAVIVPALAGMANSLGQFDRVSVGFPGAVRGGKVLTAPNLGNTDWHNFDLATALRELLGAPVRVENDATVQGLGVISGTGMELVITLGTGFGFALYENGRIGPHMEMSQHIARSRKTYDEYVGVVALRKVGRKRWNRRVARIVAQLRAVVIFDRLYIGGGDAAKIDVELEKDVTVVSNQAGLTGGVHLWNEANTT